MPTASFLPNLRERIEDLLWSLWSELGIPGWERSHQSWWIDPEALLLFTATIDPIDPRLRDEAIAWCHRYRRYLSTTRIRSLLRSPLNNETSLYQPQLARFLATVPIGRALGLDPSTQPYPFRHLHSSEPNMMRRAALLSLRLRSLLGITAKAEIVRVFLARSEAPLTASDLVEEGVGYTKRAIRDALEDLRMGGFVVHEKFGNRAGYRFLARRNFTTLLDLGPLRFPKWQHLLAVLRGILDLKEGIGRFRPSTRPIQIRRSLLALQPEIVGAGLRPPAADTGPEGIVQMEDWIGRLLQALSSDSADVAVVWSHNE